MVLPLPLCSLTNRAASRNSFNVFCRSIIWIPLRSPKIYSFIFGFQRRVWWPKWTPASSNSFIVISTAKVPPQEIDVCKPRIVLQSKKRSAAEHPFAGSLPAVNLACAAEAGQARTRQPHKNVRLALAELEALAGALLPVLLAFAHARIARQETVLAQ